ncbi:MAG: hypothetical protein HKL90_00535 [Elusimicrobia bacterium]|nr:hypothetical protein [Elusimicrobiota bacterium]
MEGDWVDGLERRFGFLAAPGLPGFVAGMTALVGALGLFKPEFVDALTLDSGALAHGQLWRALTFVAVPPPTHPLWLILWVALLYACLQALQNAWGDFKLTVFLGLGALATALGCLAVGRALSSDGAFGVQFGNSFVILAAFLAFARLLPDREVLIMFILPVKLRWLAALAAVWTVAQFLGSGAAARVEIASGLSPYLLFFGPGHWRDARFAWRRWRAGVGR